MSQKFNTANFKYILINEVGLCTILHSITRNDISQDFRISERLYHCIIDNFKTLLRYLNNNQNLILI